MERPAQEILDEDNITGPVVEGDELLVGVGDTVYKATLKLTLKEMLFFAYEAVNPEGMSAQSNVQALSIILDKFSPVGIEDNLTNVKNFEYIAWRWSQAVADKMTQQIPDRTEESADEPETDNDTSEDAEQPPLF